AKSGDHRSNNSYNPNTTNISKPVDVRENEQQKQSIENVLKTLSVSNNMPSRRQEEKPLPRTGAERELLAAIKSSR
ncbi:MAG: hypothetical protein WCG10_08520, partial [Chlamydiota bacterium]